MPSLQFDSPRDYNVATKKLLAREMGNAYARIMGAAVELVTVAVRDLGRGGVWRCSADEPSESALVMCDVRAGRTTATRADLAEALIAICVEHGRLSPEQIKVEFTQHPGDDMYHPHLGGFNRDWTTRERPDQTGDGQS